MIRLRRFWEVGIVNLLKTGWKWSSENRKCGLLNSWKAFSPLRSASLQHLSLSLSLSLSLTHSLSLLSVLALLVLLCKPKGLYMRREYHIPLTLSLSFTFSCLCFYHLLFALVAVDPCRRVPAKSAANIESFHDKKRGRWTVGWSWCRCCPFALCVFSLFQWECYQSDRKLSTDPFFLLLFRFDFSSDIANERTTDRRRRRRWRLHCMQLLTNGAEEIRIEKEESERERDCVHLRMRRRHQQQHQQQQHV